MIRRFWNWLFTPRVVEPFFKELREYDPEWWESYREDKPSDAFRAFAIRNPDHPFSERVFRDMPSAFNDVMRQRMISVSRGF